MDSSAAGGEDGNLDPSHEEDGWAPPGVEDAGAVEICLADAGADRCEDLSTDADVPGDLDGEDLAPGDAEVSLSDVTEDLSEVGPAAEVEPEVLDAAPEQLSADLPVNQDSGD